MADKTLYTVELIDLAAGPQENLERHVKTLQSHIEEIEKNIQALVDHKKAVQIAKDEYETLLKTQAQTKMQFRVA